MYQGHHSDGSSIQRHSAGMSKYKLNVARDVDTDEPEGPILNLPRGWRFSDDVVHVRGFDTMRELRDAVKHDVIPCDCSGCRDS